jgi:hypothetical protein
MNRLVLSTVILTLLVCNSLLAQKSDNSKLGDPIRSYLNLNNISTVFMNNGISDVNTEQNTPRFVFPKGTGKSAVYQSGLLWGAVLNRPTEQDPHVGGSVYRSGLQGGKIISQGVAEDPNLPHVRIYRVRPDLYPGGPPVDLSVEANDEGKTELEIRTQYELDWTEWRAQDGAPFYDVDENGIYNPNVDIPGIPGASQTIWFVANDLNPSLTSFMYGTQPMGVEYQATYWEYKNGSILDNLFFRKYKLINKSEVQFNDMYISMWSDPDVGNSGDDYVGCDTTLNMVYAYNGYEYDLVYDNYPPPAVGFDLLKGPTIQGNQNLPMTAAYYFLSSDPTLTDPVQGSFPEGAVRFYRFMQGRIGLTNEPFVDPITGLPTHFALSGDPLTGVGWIDGLQFGAGDRRVGLASGPFNMAVGDTQEVVVAEIAGIGSNRLESYQILKYYDVLAQTAFDNGLETISSMPPRPEAPNTAVTGTTWKIKLNWGLDTASVSLIENFNQDGYAFQGYNVYQLGSPLPIKENTVRIATFDIIDGVTEIPGIVMDPETGLPVNGIQQYGSDSGIERMLLTNYDYIEDTYMKVGKKYYFAVTAYTYNSDPQADPNNSESLLEVIEAVFYDSLGGASYGDSIIVTHSQGIGDGQVYVTVDDATQLTGDNYEVFFNQQTYFRNENGEWIPIGPGGSANGPSQSDDLTGSTIDIGAVYGEQGGSLELTCHLNLVSTDFDWADGITMTFPVGTTILEAPSFQTNNGSVYPEIVGNTLNLGEVGGVLTGNGVFSGDEEWSVSITPYQLPITVDWLIYDDGYSGNPINAVGNTVIEEIGYEFKTEDHWNVLNLTTQDTVLEDQTVIMGYDLYTGEYVGDPVVEGFKISVDANYDSVRTYGSVKLNGTELTVDQGTAGNPGARWANDFWSITDYTYFGYPTGSSYYAKGYGTQNQDLLQEDYEFKWTGIEELVNINGQLVYITQDGTGSMATLYGARQFDIANHPLNPNPGSSNPFLVRIPFEVWNTTTNQQINYQFYDRSQSDPTANYFKVWYTENRTYGEILNTSYDPTHIANGEMGGSDSEFYTWNNVWYLSQWTTGDIMETIYLGPITSNDKFIFTTPEGVVSVDDEFVPTRFQVFQNYPNPFNPSTIIRFALPKQTLVKLDIYNILGERVLELINTELTAGTHEVIFNGLNLASGIYFYQLQAGQFLETKKMILLK